MRFPHIFLCTCLAAMLLSCERVVFDDEEATGGGQTKGNVTITVAGATDYANGPSTRATTDITKVCTRLCLAFYKDGERVKSINQKQEDKNYGTFSTTLDAGDYQLLLLAHSGAANPSTTHAEKIQFTNRASSGSSGTGFSDTFYYYGDVSVGADGLSGSYTLKRATAMIQFVSTDAKPAGCRKLYFYYTGGSGAFDATTGYGCVDSKQIAIFDSPASADGQPVTVSLYTFPHQDNDELKITFNVYDAADAIVLSRDFEGIAATRNTISRYKGELFKDAGAATPEPPTPTPQTGKQSPVIAVDTTWTAINEYGL